MEFEYRRPELEQTLANTRDFDALEAALKATAGLAPDLGKAGIRGRQMFSPGLDAAVPVLARRLSLQDIPQTASNDNVCIVATQLYAVGGHSKVAYDISELIGADRTTVVLTDIYRRLQYRSVIGARAATSPLKRRADILLTAPTLIEKAVELYNILAAIRPSRIFMLTHHFDMVAQVALWPFRSVVEYLHHADHLPTLGATLPWSRHVDLTYRCHQVCRRAGLAPVYAGLGVSSGDTEATPPTVTPKQPGRLRIATCGQIMKYRGGISWRWLDFAAAALRRPNTEILHVGAVDDAFRAEVAGGLAQAGIDPAAYIFAGPAPNLAAALVANEVDVYLSSYPEGGGKASVEAMSVGLPPIVPIEPEAPELLRFDFPADTWIMIAGPDELADAIEKALVRSQAMIDAPNPVAAELERFRAYVLNPPR